MALRDTALFDAVSFFFHQKRMIFTFSPITNPLPLRFMLCAGFC